MGIHGETDAENGICRSMGKIDNDVYFDGHILGFDKWGTSRAHYPN